MKALSRALVIASMLVPSVVAAQQPALSEADRKLIVQEVIEHFRKNPAELLAAVSAGKPPEQEKTNFAGAAMDPVHGPSDAPYSILVFSDYGCAPCNDVEKMLDGLLTERSDIKIVHRDYPVSGEHSVAASLDVIAAYNATPPQDWLKLRAGLMEKGVDPEYRIEALRAAGIEQSGDVNASVKLAILRNRELARRAGVNTLPAIVVMKGDGVVPISGTVTREGVMKALDLLKSD